MTIPRGAAGRIRDLTAWFRASARDLPWRRRRTPYTALVAEAMLQQTQVARVLPRYRAFVRRFPSVRALASADEDDVLAAWQGLGYYRRARALHAAARRVCADHGGRVPTEVDLLRELPGVGRYTAGAIASIVGGQAVPIVDGNVRRVLARWHADDPAAEAAAEAWCWTRATSYVGAAPDPGAFNEGLMELGATVCTPKAPRCDACPVARSCAARRLGVVERVPAAKPAAARRTVHHHAVLVRRGTRMLFVKRGPTGLWAGLWQTPTVETPAALEPDEVGERLEVRLAGGPRRVGGFVHQTTHRRVTFHVFTATSRARKGTWREPNDVGDLALSNAQKKVLAFAE